MTRLNALLYMLSNGYRFIFCRDTWFRASCKGQRRNRKLVVPVEEEWNGVARDWGTATDAKQRISSGQSSPSSSRDIYTGVVRTETGHSSTFA